VFSGPRSGYTVTGVGDHLVVTQTGANVTGQKVTDGTDTLRNVEQLQFSDSTVRVAVPNAPVIGAATAGNGSATVRWTAPTGAGAPAVTGYEITATPATGAPIVKSGYAGSVTSGTFTGLTNGTSYTFTVRAVNDFGAGAASAASNAVVPTGTVAAVAPGAPTIGTATVATQRATVAWAAPTTGGAPTGYVVQARNAAGTVLGSATLASTARTGTVGGLPDGTTLTLRVQATNAAGPGPFSANSNAVTTPAATPVATVPGAPTIGTAAAGVAGGVINATARWTAPTVTGGSAVTGYRVRALRMSSTNTVLATTTSALQPAAARTLVMTLPVTGNYRFTVQAVNAIGIGAQSSRSPLVAAG
jgi:hypothetical protein